MIRFESDYTEGAHERIMNKMVATNRVQTSGYGVDEYCERARQYIRTACGNEAVDVHFLVGGTQTNMTVISSILRPHQGVIAAVTGHIAVHETGAIEATGHKILTLPSDDGKITAAQVQQLYEQHWNDATHEHITQPGMVYISQPTENGTIYSHAELEALYEICQQHDLPLYIDGARLGYALASPENDLTLERIAELCDVFYIGGTKVGALMGEAVVFVNDRLKKDFRYLIKQRGGMLAKGRILGIQFETLFEDGLYMEVSQHAVQQALRIRDAFAAQGFTFRYDSSTNQQFPIVSHEVLDKLRTKYSFSLWEKVDEQHSAIRFCTSWATQVQQVDELVNDIAQLEPVSSLTGR
ncbi:threonine aldolase family protein [Paenibacillus hunanensis]|uniref:Threonine aldolase n=1 Tax=Paenibacillus hunanensis TaxID=539262 RepID=A0ABU1IVI8_9BACL|nr:low specificity L-threonine aldolase [Paenibacillus hunanensis]MDR6243284.1 threonine aldolase [Paenibacillus hunanensis]GGJ10423.1 amino acid lyase [Paenibacillus hunanensis]